MTETAVPQNAHLDWQTARIVDIVVHTSRIKSFFFSLAKPFTHRAGQHVDLRLTAPDGYTAMRSYSIASAPGGKDGLELAIERLDRGEVSPFFHDVAQIGDEIELRGPLGGHFVWSPKDGGPLLLVGGGSGVVPLMAMIRHRQVVAAKLPTVILLSARQWEDVPFREELLQLDRKAPAFEFILTLTRESVAGRASYARRIDSAMMADVLERFSEVPRYVFICGSNAFVNAAADAAVAGGLQPSLIRTERYGA